MDQSMALPRARRPAKRRPRPARQGACARRRLRWTIGTPLPEGAGPPAGPAPYGGKRKAGAGFPLPKELLPGLTPSVTGPE